MELMTHMKKAQAKAMTCIDVIADEENSELAIFFDAGNTGKYVGKQFHSRVAGRMKLEDGKATSFHMVFDTSNWMKPESPTVVKDWATGYCDMLPKLEPEKLV